MNEPTTFYTNDGFSFSTKDGDRAAQLCVKNIFSFSDEKEYLQMYFEDVNNGIPDEKLLFQDDFIELVQRDGYDALMITREDEYIVIPFEDDQILYLDDSEIDLNQEKILYEDDYISIFKKEDICYLKNLTDKDIAIYNDDIDYEIDATDYIILNDLAMVDKIREGYEVKDFDYQEIER